MTIVAQLIDFRMISDQTVPFYYCRNYPVNKSHIYEASCYGQVETIALASMDLPSFL
jgi:hypothetical protein